MLYEFIINYTDAQMLYTDQMQWWEWVGQMLYNNINTDAVSGSSNALH